VNQKQLKKIVLLGFMGAGKTTVGRHLSTELECPWFDMDDVIISKTNYSSVAEIFDTEGEDCFRRLEAQVFSELRSLSCVVISTGGGIVTNRYATSYLEESRDAGETIFLKTDFLTVLQRVGRSEKGNAAFTRPLFRDEQKAEELFYQRAPLYEKFAYQTVESTNESPKTVTQLIRASLNE
jgi:shikimate kinase